MHVVVAPSSRSLLALSSISPSSIVSSRPSVVVPSITISVVSSVPVAPVVTIPVPVSIATVAVSAVIVSRRAVSVFVVTVVICEEKEWRKGHAGKQNRIRKTRSVRLVGWCVGMHHGMGCTRSTLLFSTTGVGWLWMLGLAEGRGNTWCAGRENKCHHESLGYWETRTDGRGIRRKIITSVVFDKSACSEENGSENVQKMKQRRYVPASSAMATQRCVFG